MIMSNLFDKIYELKMIKSQTTPLGTTCDTSLLYEVLDEAEELENENTKLKDLLLQIIDIGPDNRDCVYQCIQTINTILKADISPDINKACKVGLDYLTGL